jgi:acyl-coenzyme A synthetase/AMP-(fatty) acid ligase
LAHRAAASEDKPLLAPHKYPRRIEFVPELPKTATGEIQRFKLRALYAHADTNRAALPH